MINIKNQKGAITLVVLISVLFFITFLTSTYLILSNKAQIQVETTRTIKERYNQENAQDVYRSYFETGPIPIYTPEQLLNIGTNKNIAINEVRRKNI